MRQAHGQREKNYASRNPLVLNYQDHSWIIKKQVKMRQIIKHDDYMT